MILYYEGKNKTICISSFIRCGGSLSIYLFVYFTCMHNLCFEIYFYDINDLVKRFLGPILQTHISIFTFSFFLLSEQVFIEQNARKVK